MWYVQQPPTLKNREPAASSSVASLLSLTLHWQRLRSPWWLHVARIGILLLTDLLPLLWLFPLGYAGMGLYPGFGVGAAETLRRLSYCTSFAFLVLAAGSFALKLPHYYSRMTFAIVWGTSLAFVPLWRFLVLSVACRWRWWGEPTVLIGDGPWVQWAIRSLGNALSLGYRPVAVLMPDGHQQEHLVEGVPVFGN